ncbi:hypothetical protein GRX03_00775 [Halovenus sp. WSH3]|uniref:Uncharacterized protein n=1 Tax=Halovenus carboxidivorans TaxID=2692199 RepID=A0A6B0SX43_9EURY|nr:HTH domain-containing protein [Halovenus carboxidivorans]MXR50144.1 hypothetical protein [Halovenus carboxidivorans]
MSANRTLTLFVRSLAPEGTGGNQRTALDRLESLSDQGVVDDYEIRVWGDRIAHDEPIARTGAGRRLRDRLAEFEAWADRNERDIGRFFRRERIDSAVTQTTREVTTLPTMALAEYEGEELVYLTPNEGETGAESVLDRLDTLASEQAETPGAAVPALD